ncbi:uncharacterized protein LOC108145957 [Drosophila elegans]|uniref:uncharacterized protein LOC108145957 n=1 Tax=Drosophila elegans TaxID=30023 RepID=UPI0007E717B6|nr:uncharacterized protein LOC108145957 [Drosophila elegans]
MGKRVEKRQRKMWGNGLILALPLVSVLILSASAQTVTSSPVPKDDGLGDAALPSRTAVKILEDGQTISAVQDWSLLCKELCGAGLGVASTPDGAKNPILRPEFEVAKCRQLCGLPRGVVGDLVCSSFCEQRDRRLPGCSPCQQEVRRRQKEQEEKEQKDVRMEDRKEETMASVQQGDPAHGPSSETNIIQRTVDAASVPPVVAGLDTDATTLAPDWNEVCKVLCKTGDGGSLCNCDLSPFFS